MTVPDTTLAEYVSASQDDTAFVATCNQQARVLVSSWIQSHAVDPNAFPEEVRDLAQVLVGAELYHRRGAPNGLRNFADGMGGVNPIRVARDPMVAAYPLLTPHARLGFA